MLENTNPNDIQEFVIAIYTVIKELKKTIRGINIMLQDDFVPNFEQLLDFYSEQKNLLNIVNQILINMHQKHFFSELYKKNEDYENINYYSDDEGNIEVGYYQIVGYEFEPSQIEAIYVFVDKEVNFNLFRDTIIRDILWNKEITDGMSEKGQKEYFEFIKGTFYVTILAKDYYVMDVGEELFSKSSEIMSGEINTEKFNMMKF